MKIMIRSLLCLSAAAVFVLALHSAAFAESSSSRTQFGHDISVGPDETVSDITCFGCSVRVRGHVESDVTTFGGSVIVEDQGQVDGDMTTFAGSVRLDGASKVTGNLTVFGGRIHRDPGASVGGDITTFTGTAWLLLIFGLPLAIFAAFITLIVWLIRMAVRPRVPAAA